MNKYRYIYICIYIYIHACETALELHVQPRIETYCAMQPMSDMA